MVSRLKFISYNGNFPNLCSGHLVIELDGNQVTLGENEYFWLHSGGRVWFDNEWGDHTEHGPWTIEEFPEWFPKELQKELVELINDNIREGCCGGCI